MLDAKSIKLVNSNYEFYGTKLDVLKPIVAKTKGISKQIISLHGQKLSLYMDIVELVRPCIDDLTAIWKNAHKEVKKKPSSEVMKMDIISLFIGSIIDKDGKAVCLFSQKTCCSLYTIADKLNRNSHISIDLPTFFKQVQLSEFLKNDLDTLKAALNKMIEENKPSNSYAKNADLESILKNMDLDKASTKAKKGTDKGTNKNANKPKDLGNNASHKAAILEFLNTLDHKKSYSVDELLLLAQTS